MERKLDKAKLAGLRVVAVYEAVKGIAVLLFLLFGYQVLKKADWEFDEAVRAVIEGLHFDPDGHYPSLVREAAAKVTDMQLWLIAIGCVVYAALRFFETYGLWKNLAWGSWLGVLSGLIYVPFEIYELSERVTWFRAGLLIANIVIVLLLAFNLRGLRKPSSPHSQHPLELPPV